MCNCIEEIDLSHTRSLTDDAIKHFITAQGAHLTSIQLESLPVNPFFYTLFYFIGSYFAEHVPLSPLFNSQFLSFFFLFCLVDVKNLTDEALLAIADHCPDLEDISISWCREVTDDALFKIANSCRKITSISVWGCTQVNKNSRCLLMI